MSFAVFVNDRMLQVEPGTTARAAALLAEPDLAADLAGGRAYLTDGRGIRCDPDTLLGPGAILRAIRSARRGPDA